jgi:type II restriction enzyme
LAVLISFSKIAGNKSTENLLHEILKSVEALNPSKDACAYWHAVNRTMLGFSNNIGELWKLEKQAAVESIAIAKELALIFLASEREKIMRMKHDEALRELIRVHKLDSKIKIIQSLTGNDIMDMR